MSYQANIFYLGQRYRAEVIQLLAAKRFDICRLPASIDAGEVIRKSFYARDTAEYCAGLIETAIEARRAACRANFN